MDNQHTFTGITQDQWTCVQKTSTHDHGTKYDPPAPSNQGTSTTKVFLIGTIVATYDFDPSTGDVDYTVTSKPEIVSYNQIWSGIQDTIDGCA